MVKFIATNKENGRKILGLGLSHGNVAKLMIDQPIHINAEQMGIPLLQVNEILIFVGETEDAIQKDFTEKGFLEGTKILIDAAKEH